MVPDGFNILALCAGGGGLELGIELALPAARTVCVVEIEAFACEVLASAHENHGLGAPIGWTDLGTFNARPWRGIVDCVSAGIPCQPHSVAGKRMGAGDERNLWPDAERIIRECEPPFVFLENVGGAVAFFGEHVVGGLEAMGYRVETGLFSAEEVGAPHGRERLFVLGFLAHSVSGGHGNRKARGSNSKAGAIPVGGRQQNGKPVSVTTPSRDVADAPRICEAGPGGEDRRRGGGTERTGAAVADAEHLPSRTGEQGIEGDEAGHRRRGPPDGGAELALFPPGPGLGGEGAINRILKLFRKSPEAAWRLYQAERRNTEAWATILQGRPDLAPAAESPVQRVADGLASRVDRLSMLGNGVVPLAAAYAFATLLARLEHSLSAE